MKGGDNVNNKENPILKYKTDNHCKRNCHCPLKMSFIINICLIVLSAIVVNS